MSRRGRSRIELFVVGLRVGSLLLWVLFGTDRFLYMTLGFGSILFIFRTCTRNNRNE